MSKLIIVCGLPGSGKTTLAQQLSKRTNIVRLHQDSFKEILYEKTGSRTLEHSKKLGDLSVKLLLCLTEEILANKTDLIIESPFNYVQDYQIIQSWIDRYNSEVISIVCSADQDELRDRFFSRPRHHAHHDSERHYVPQDEKVYAGMPGKQYKIITNKPVEELVDHLFEAIFKNPTIR